MEGSELFYKNAAGRIVRLESFISLFPGRENGLKMLFGGEILKSMDEISGNLATLFAGQENYQAVHAGEIVYFEKPITTAEVGRIIARVVLCTDKIVCVYIEVYGGSPRKPEAFTLRYEGFGLCVILDASDPEHHRMVQNLEPYNDGSPIVPIARKAIAFQKRTRNALKSLRQPPTA